MADERRRYFRINETVGIAYQLLDKSDDMPLGYRAPNVLDLIKEQDKKLERLLIEVEEESPKVAELVAVFNQKLERIVNQLMVESNLISRIAEKVREVNLSACGIAFLNDESIPENSALNLEMTLHPDNQKIQTEGRVISCEPSGDGENYYLRIDFYTMNPVHQEILIQHIVKAQSNQIKELRK